MSESDGNGSKSLGSGVGRREYGGGGLLGIIELSRLENETTR